MKAECTNLMTSITLRQKVETFIFLFVVIFICQKKSKNYSWRISIFLADLANFVQSFSAYYFVLFIFSVNFVSKQMLAINFDQISIEIKRWNSSDHFVEHLGCFFSASLNSRHANIWFHAKVVNLPIKSEGGKIIVSQNR